jgi:hypothetical protein
MLFSCSFFHYRVFYRDSLEGADFYAVAAGDATFLDLAFRVYHGQDASGTKISARPAAGTF